MIAVRSLLLSLLAILIAVEAPRSALAQSFPLSFFEVEPGRLVEAAFSTPYGRLLNAEFAAVLAESADAACLKARGIETSALAERARAIPLRHGAQYIGKYVSAVDKAAYKAKLASRMGAGAEAELIGLRDDKDVRAFVALSELVRNAAIVNAVMETLDRNILVLRIKLSRLFHPLSTGNPKLLNADPSNRTHDKLEAFMKGNKSAALARYIELTGAAQDALNQSIDAKALLNMRIVDLMPGLDNDMADICVGRR